MSDLIAIAYPDEAAARRACTNLTAGIEKRLLDVDDVLVITHDEDGRIYPILDAWEVGFAGGVSVIAGGLIGALLVGPLLGMVLGGTLAAHTANRIFNDEGVPEEFVNELRKNLAPGTAALIVIVREMHPDDILPKLREPGHTIHTTLGNELEKQLDAALTAAKRRPSD
jgi:uncharacterized membrane protein